LLVPFLLVIQYSYSAPCSELTSCSTCFGNASCGWCATVGECVDGNAQGPNVGFCNGPAWEYQTCAKCSSFSDCRQCNERNADCFWCSGTAKCLNLGYATCQPDPNYECPCGNYQSCSDCVVNDCVWCKDNANPMCVAKSAGCKLSQLNCPCGDNMDCSSCKDDHMGACYWCNANANCVSKYQNQSCPHPPPLSSQCLTYCALGANNCEDCGNLNGCSWCPSRSMCTDSAAPCNGGFQYNCPRCEVYTSCNTCLDEEDCSWCPSTGKCELTVKSTCETPGTCEQYCQTFSNCDGCTNTVGCAWCENSNKCTSIESNTLCLLSHSCPEKPFKCPFNAGSFVGGMFLVVGIGAVVGVVFAYYRYRGRGQAYYQHVK